MNEVLRNLSDEEIKKQFRITTGVLPVLKFFVDRTSRGKIRKFSKSFLQLKTETGFDLFSKDEILKGTGLKGSTLAKCLRNAVINKMITPKKVGTSYLYYMDENQYKYTLILFDVVINKVIPNNIQGE